MKINTIIGIVVMAALAGCTVQMNSDTERFGRIEKALEGKADAGVVQQNFQFLANQVNGLKQGQQTKAAE